MSDKKLRIQYWDMAKGFTILLVIIGHISNVNPYLRGVIFSFHMPFYFMANGYFIKDYSLRKTIKKSAKSLLIPYSIVCIISTAWYTIKYWQWGSADNLLQIRDKLVAMLWGISKASTILKEVHSVWLVWFVICLFVARIIYVIVMRVLSKFKIPIQIVVIFLISIAGMIIGEQYAFLPWSLDVALVSLPFLMVGEYLSKYHLLENKFKSVMFTAAILWIVPLGMKIYIELATRDYPMGLISVLEAVGGSVCVVGFFYFLEKHGILCSQLSWLGRNSMIVLAVHCLEMMYFDWDKYVFAILLVENIWWMAAIVKVIVIVAVAWVIVWVKDFPKKPVRILSLTPR